jgi:hypothetical protein
MISKISKKSRRVTLLVIEFFRVQKKPSPGLFLKAQLFPWEVNIQSSDGQSAVAFTIQHMFSMQLVLSSR